MIQVKTVNTAEKTTARHLLEQVLVQGWRRSEGTEAAGQQQPALQLLLQAPGVVHQLGQDLVPQVRLALALFSYVVAQHLLLPGAEVRLNCKPQDLRKTGIKSKLRRMIRNIMKHNHAHIPVCECQWQFWHHVAPEV